MTKLMKTAALAAVLVAFLASTALALELRAAEPKNGVREGQAVVTELAPNASATTYWVAESDGWHVVTTIDIVLGEAILPITTPWLAFPRCFSPAKCR
jgi:hypothetical protein